MLLLIATVLSVCLAVAAFAVQATYEDG